MADDAAPRARHGKAFWRAHHEAWRRSDLNQREYCESQGLSLKAFGNRRAQFKAEPQPPARKLLYRRGGASHSLGHTASHSLGHVTYPSFAPPGPIVPPARAGSATVQRVGPASYPGRGGRAKRQRIGGRTALWHRPTRAVSVAAGAGEQAASATPAFVDVDIVDPAGVAAEVAL
jgi:hypothetical protein